MEQQGPGKISKSKTATSLQPQVVNVHPSQSLGEELDALPQSYGRTTIVLMVVNPYLVHVYWEVAPKDLEDAKALRDSQAQPALRFYDVTGISFDGTNAHRCFDVDVQLAAENWYVHLWSPAKSYVVDLGLRTADGSFLALARSNIAHTPPAWPSTRVDVQYPPVGSTVEEMNAAESPEREPDVAIPPGKVLEDRPLAVIDMARTVWKKLAELYRRLRGEEPGCGSRPAGESSGASGTAASTQTTGTRYADLTQMNENGFISGMSSR